MHTLSTGYNCQACPSGSYRSNTMDACQLCPEGEFGNSCCLMSVHHMMLGERARSQCILLCGSQRMRAQGGKAGIERTPTHALPHPRALIHLAMPPRYVQLHPRLNVLHRRPAGHLHQRGRSAGAWFEARVLWYL